MWLDTCSVTRISIRMHCWKVLVLVNKARPAGELVKLFSSHLLPNGREIMCIVKWIG